MSKLRKFGVFGALVRAHRLNARFTLGNLAVVLGISGSNLSEIERGRRRPMNFKQIERTVAALHLPDDSANELFETALLEVDGAKFPISTKYHSELAILLLKVWPTLLPDEVKKLTELIKEICELRTFYEGLIPVEGTESATQVVDVPEQ